tara:strand:- start:943 stop:1296 length:354 start_codon:yes stop_codon:yes gene_type:complete
MKKINSKIKRKIRNRKKLRKVNTDKLRVCVFKSSKNISAQIIDDKISKTLVSASSTEKVLKKTKSKKMDLSNILGELLAKRAKEKKISNVYFDRGGYKYHGRIKALADSLRKNGLKI